MPELDGVLFDFGGVFTASPFTSVETYAEGLGEDPARFLELVFGPYAEDTNHPWHRLERGEIALVEAREAILEQSRSDGTEVDLFSVLRAMVEGSTGSFIREAMVECVRELRAAGLRTALVTNNAAEFAPSWRPLLPLDELFDAVVDSSEVGLRKPDPRIYHLALERVGGIAPGRAAFLDDYPGNVDAARNLGLHGVVVGDPVDDAVAELRRLVAG